MIEIYVRPKSYNRSELEKLFNAKYPDGDFDEWFTAMEITGQLERKGNRFFPTVVSRGKPQKKTLLIQPRKIGVHTSKDISVWHWTSRKIKEGIQKRIAIRAGEDWVKKQGIPSKIKLNRVFKDGKWISLTVDEKRGELIPRKPREYSTEKYLQEIPASIVQKYDLTGDEPVEIIVTEISKEYFGILKLWGYILKAMLAFGQTGEHKSDRDFELLGYDFIFETKGNIASEIEKIGGRIIDVMRSWLKQYDTEYNVFLTYGVNEIETTPPELIEGIGPEPLIKHPRKKQKIHFSDEKGLIVPVSASLPLTWYEQSDEQMAMLFSFSRPEVDRIGYAHGYKGRSTTYTKLKKRQITLSDVFKKDNSGEGFKKRKK